MTIPIQWPPDVSAGTAAVAGVCRLRPHLTVEHVTGEGVYLVGERVTYVLRGALVTELVGYLGGEYHENDIVAALADRYPPERVLYALGQLRERGYVVDVPADADTRAMALWESAGYDGAAALSALAAARCRLETVDAPAGDVGAALARAGLSVTTGQDPADLRIVLVDDYLNPALADVAARTRTSGEPWLLARLAQSRVWVGPVFEPGTTGCWQCLATRLGRNRVVHTYLRERTGSWPVIEPGGSPVTASLAADLVALRAARWTVRATAHRGSAAAAADHTCVEEIEPLSGELARHAGVRRPQCPACGDPEMMARRGRARIVPVTTLPAVANEGGLRARTPEYMVESLRPLVSPITGVIKELASVRGTTSRELPEVVHTYTAGHNFAINVPHLSMLKEGLRSRAAGKGTTAITAQAGAICEAIERYSGLYEGDEACVRASYRELGDTAIHPNDCTLFSERQYADRDRWNAGDSSFSFVGKPLDPDLTMSWSPVQSLTGGAQRYLPTAQLYYHYPQMAERAIAWADSNGCAAGSTPEDALLQGMLELVERDAVAVWWYNRLRRPAVDLAGFGDPYAEHMRAAYRTLDRDLWVLDLTHDLGVPVFGAISRRLDKPVEDIVLAFGAHLDPAVALRRCLTELNQFLPAVVDVTADGTGYAFPDPVQQRWWRTARLADHPHLAADDGVAPVGPAARPTQSSGDIAVDLRLLIDRFTAAGVETYALDQTRPDIGVPVYKVIAPGIRHFWARFAPGRLYDVPVALGWLDEPTAEDALNPIPMFV